MADTVPGNTVSQDDSATLPSLIVTNFFTGATPLFAKLADLSAFAQVQYAYYASIGVGQPLLGPYEALGRGFAETDIFKTKYGVLTTDFVPKAYNDVFGRAPTAAQTTHFNDQVSYFVSIYTKVGVAADTAALLAKGAVIGQMLGVAALTGESVFDYSGAAKSFIAKMDGAGFVPGQPLSNFDDAPATPGGGGGGGGGGGSPPPSAGFVSNDGILHVTLSGTTVLTKVGADWVLTNGSSVTTVNPATITTIQLDQSNAKVDLAAAIANGAALTVKGAVGTTNTSANISNVHFTPYPAGVDGGSVLTDINISKLVFQVANPLLVNNSATDGFKALWDVLDNYYSFIQSTFPVIGNQALFNNVAGYGDTTPLGTTILGQTTLGAAAKAVNMSVTELSIQYAKYLTGHSDTGDLTAFLAKGSAAGRAQTIHDNLLGGATDLAIGIRKYDPAVETAFKADLATSAPDFASRVVASGNPTDADRKMLAEAKAFDFAHNVNRLDFVSHKGDTAIDEVGQKADNSMFFGNGNTSDNFNVGRHDGAGIEIALKAKLRTAGPDIEPVVTQADGTTHYNVPDGAGAAAGWGVPAKWNFDFSVLTGLNGANKALSDLNIKLFIDKDASKATNFEVLTLDTSGPVNPWRDSNGVAQITDDDTITTGGSQNSVNFGFAFLKNNVDGNAAQSGIQAPYNFGQGQFDIRISATDKVTGQEYVSTNIVAHVGSYWDL